LSMAICLICSLPLDAKDHLYHPKCASLFFGRKTGPILDLSLDDIRKAATQIIKTRVTVPGVQKKLSLHLSRKRGDSRITLVGLWGDLILKPPVVEYPFMPEIEHISMSLAELFGLHVVPHALIPMRSGELAYITRRIDRLPGGEKLHMEDMCQLSVRLTEDKYKGSIEQIGKILDNYSSNPLLDKLRLFDLVLFSFLSGNADMHLKNFSLIYPLHDMVQLAPAYDLLATRLLISEKEDPEESALAINGKRRKLKREEFVALAINLGMKDIQLKNRLIHFHRKLNAALEFLERSLLPKDIKSKYLEIMRERVRRISL